MKTPKHKPETPAVAYSYQRFSSPQQAEGDSIRRQTDLRDRWLQKTGAVLDTSVTLRDMGKSAFTGKHRENPDRNALAVFLQLVEQGRIPRGSFLVVESLDRLTREHIQPALLLFLNLLQAGVRIVQLIPVEQVFDDKSEAMQIMMAVMELTRGHGESAVKSERLSAVWREKKRKAAPGVIISRACPGWIEVRGGKYTLVPPKVETVRRIFRLATDGLGPRSIVRVLKAEGVPPVSSRGDWNASYVRLILSSRATFGEYQPMTGAGAGRKPDGKAVPNFYPAAVTEQEWYAAQGAKKTHTAGRPAKQGVNVFAGLAFDALTGSPLQMHTYRHAGQCYPALIPAAREHGGEPTSSFPMRVFEQAVLSCLKEIDPREVLPEDTSGDAVLALSGRRAELETRREQIKGRLVGDDDFASLADVLKRVDAELKRVDAELSEARQRAASPVAEAWGECRGLADALDAEESRFRLRAALRRMVEGVWAVFAGRRKGKLAGVRVQFVGGVHRDYLIAYKPEHVGYGGRRPARWWVRSFADVAAPGDLDLRRRDHAARLEKVLARLDPSALAGE